MEILQIGINHHYYPQEQELRNEILLRPIGVPDHGWEMHDEISYHFVAVHDSQVLACVVLRPILSKPNEDRTAQLMQMAVKTSLQTTGIGRKLVDFLIEFAKQEGFKQVI